MRVKKCGRTKKGLRNGDNTHHLAALAAEHDRTRADNEPVVFEPGQWLESRPSTRGRELGRSRPAFVGVYRSWG